MRMLCIASSILERRLPSTKHALCDIVYRLEKYPSNPENGISCASQGDW
jgi:hypothetical protein